MYEGGKLTNFFSKPVKDATKRVSHDIAEDAGHYMTERARARTPVKTGLSRASLIQKPLREVAKGWESGVESDYENVRRLEYGTRPHAILPHPPRRALRFEQNGSIRFASRVYHPGTRGIHMVAIAATETEHKFTRISKPALERWKKEVEGSVKRT